MKKKSKAPIVIAICAVVLFAAAVIFIVTKGLQGGGIDPDKARFERELKEKYGEEFVCLDLERSSVFDKPMTIRSVCAPVRDTTLTFTAEIDIDLNGTRNFDDYPYALANRQLSEEITEKLSGIWNDLRVKSNVLTYEDPDSDESIRKIKDGSFDWRHYFEQSPLFIECIVLIDNSKPALSYEEEWNALQEILEEYNEELNKISFADANDIPGLSLYLYFAPSDLYAECAAKINEPLTLNNEDDIYKYFEEKFGAPCGVGAGYGLTSDMISECKEPYLEYRKNIGKSDE